MHKLVDDLISDLYLVMFSLYSIQEKFQKKVGSVFVIPLY